MTGDHADSSELGEVVLYATEDGVSHIQCRMVHGAIWLSQRGISELYQTTAQNITIHLRRIYGEGELHEAATCKEYLQVQDEGDRRISRLIKHYSLEIVLAVGYRVRSARGTQFRQWATARLQEYLLKGFVIDDERLKSPPGSGQPDYFDELIERIRDIRASERRIYLRVKDILALAADYRPQEKEVQHFFQTIQNKLHFAISGRTAAEILIERADHSKPNMGLTNWKGNIVRKGDIGIAKNYLSESEIADLNLIVSMFLDYAEDQSRRRRQVFMKDWQERLDAFLEFNERPVLLNLGSTSRESAERKVAEEYTKFEMRRRSEAEALAEEEFQKLEQISKSVPKKKSDGS